MYNVWIYNGNKSTWINGRRTTNKIEGTFTRGKNFIPSCQFNIYPNNDGFYLLQEFLTTIRILDDDGKQKFGGRIISVHPSMDANGVFCKAVTCEGWLGYLNDSISYWYGYYDKTRPAVLQQLLNHHNSMVEETKAIELSEYIEDNKYIDYDYFNVNTYEAITNEEMISTGYTYEVVEDMDNNIRKLEYIHNIETSDETIELSKNLESLNIQNNFNELCTRVIPRTKNGVGIGNIPEGQMPYVDASDEAIAKYGIIMKIRDFSGVSSVAKLEDAAKRWVDKKSKIVSSFSISALELYKLGITKEKLDLYKKHKVICAPLKINEYIEIVQITEDINDEWNIQLTFGEKSYKATKYRRK